MSGLLLVGDVCEQLRTVPERSVHCCVTSPPYWALRDYGVAGQIGLEATPEEYVAKMVEVFREVWRVLRDDGTCWVNLGDSYNASPGQRKATDSAGEKQSTNSGSVGIGSRSVATLKAKDLVGIPWRVAFAMQQPYYTGKIKDERDRVWMAAMVDAEGSICGTEYKSGERTKTNIYISVTNTSIPIIDKCERLFPQDVKHVYEKTNGTSGRRCFRWDVERIDEKSLFLREIFPYLVAKRKQAMLAFAFTEMQRSLFSKKRGYLQEQHEQRSWIMSAISRLNSGDDVDIPSWVTEPTPVIEPGFYLRQDIVWAKPAPMPESVRDRCTKSHEYIFLLSKSERYYFDAIAVQEPVSGGAHHRGNGVNGKATGKRFGDKQNDSFSSAVTGLVEHRNLRDVWRISTRGFKGAHFATFPPELPERCIKAGTSERGCCPTCGAPWKRIVEKQRVATRPGVDTKVTGDAMTDGNRDPKRHVTRTVTTGWNQTCKCPAHEPIPCTVIDPFLGSGTTALMAEHLGRNWLGCELNPEYAEIARQRIAGGYTPPKARTATRRRPRHMINQLKLPGIAEMSDERR